MEDTDSMAIVATKRGGLVACPGGPQRMKDGREAVRALSWTQVDRIIERFSALNPYDSSVVPGSILKIETDNFDSKTGRRRQLHCVAISAKRYALFTMSKGELSIVRRSEHGLGHLLNPIDVGSEDGNWISQAWLRIVRRVLDLPTSRPAFDDRPAIGRITISSPAVMKPLSRLNHGKPYTRQLKPFNFLLTCHVRAFGHPEGVDAELFHLIAPWESDPGRWTRIDWIDQYSGRVYRITTRGHHGSQRAARVKTYGDVLEEYAWHPESKCADANGDASGKRTVGLLQRRHIRAAALKYIGKESNRLEDVESGLIHAAESVYTEYVDPRREAWFRAAQVVSLKEWERETGKPRRLLIDARLGRRRPHRRHRDLIVTIARRLGRL
jgi:hypothetical protein